MKKWILQNKLMFIGVALGAVAGFLYWNYVGCLTNTCAITSDPTRSTLYFSLMGGLLFSSFKNQKKKDNDENFMNQVNESEATNNS